MIVVVCLAELGLRGAVRALRDTPSPATVPGLRWAVSTTAVRIGLVPPRPSPGRVGLISAWSDEHALEDFLGVSEWGRRARDGYETRFVPLRASGRWAALPELVGLDQRGEPDDPVAVLTLGRLNPRRLPAFVHATAGAERRLLTSPGLRASTGLARPPFIATFSVWATTRDMERYAYSPDGGHRAAMAADTRAPFHRESTFIRLRPHTSRGQWFGHDLV